MDMVYLYGLTIKNIKEIGAEDYKMVRE